jgi:NTE family protein
LTTPSLPASASACVFSFTNSTSLNIIAIDSSVRAINVPALFILSLLALTGCATRPVNPKIDHVDTSAGYRFQISPAHNQEKDSLVILAFSGGGTRAAAFSYGVLEFLRRTEMVGPKGNRVRLLDQVDVITGVSGGSFTALAYGLYGEKLFDVYEKRFLKRNIQGDIVAGVLNPFNWPSLWSRAWGRSELAAKLYDKVLFNGATYADLSRGTGPFISVSATDITSGSRVPFDQAFFDVLCSNLSAVSLSHAAAASSAVPVALSPVTFNNYGGTCNYSPPDWIKPFLLSQDPPRSAARAIHEMNAGSAYKDSTRSPYIHLVDGGVSDNLGMRGVLDALETLEALHDLGLPSPLDTARRIVVFVVDSLSSPPSDWDKHERSPGTLGVLLQATGVPIDHYSYEATELLKDTATRWRELRALRDSTAFTPNRDPAVDKLLRVPNAEIYAIDVSFSQLKDADEMKYLNKQPTSFVLSSEAVDRLRAAAGKIILESPEFQRLRKDVGATSVAPSASDMPVETSPAAN